MTALGQGTKVPTFYYYYFSFKDIGGRMEINLGPLLALGSYVAPVRFRLFRFTRLGQVRASAGVASLQNWLHTVFSIFFIEIL